MYSIGKYHDLGLIGVLEGCSRIEGAYGLSGGCSSLWKFQV